MSATISVVFKSGVGQINAELFRNGASAGTGSTDATGTITFSDVRVGDAFSISGACAGTAVLTITPTTRPATPVTFQAGNIFGTFIVTAI